MRKKLLSLMLCTCMFLTSTISVFSNSIYDTYYEEWLTDVVGVDITKMKHQTIKLDANINGVANSKGDLYKYSINISKPTLITISLMSESEDTGFTVCDSTGKTLNTGEEYDSLKYVGDSLPGIMSFDIDDKVPGYKEVYRMSEDYLIQPGNYDIYFYPGKGKFNFKLNSIKLKLTIDSIYGNSTTIRGKGSKGAYVIAYVGKKKIGESKVNSGGEYSIKIPKQKVGTNITIKTSKQNYCDVSLNKKVSSSQFNTFTVNSIKSSSTKITGKGLKGATVRAYIGKKQIGKSTVKSNNTYSIRIPKQKKGKKVTVKISTSGYTTKAKSVTVKSSSTSSSSKYVYWNGGSSRSRIYHKTSKAHGMKGAVKMTKKQAKSRGYRACKSCW